MAKKDPVRGMQPMDEYNKANSLKDLAPLGVGMGVAGAAMLTSKKGSELDKAEKKAREVEGKEKSGIALDAENIKKDQQLKKEYEAYEKSKGMKKGGTASSRADGCAMRGKTRGKIV